MTHLGTDFDLETSDKRIKEIFNYIAKDNRDAAIRVLDEFDKSISRLEEFPLLGDIPNNTRMEKLGWRLLNVKNYFVFYIAKENRVEIRRIIYGWKTWGKSGMKVPDLSISGRISHEDLIKLIKNMINVSRH